MNTKHILIGLSLSLPAFAEMSSDPMIPVDHHSVGTSNPFASAVRPITAPTVFDLAAPRTQANLIYMNQSLSDNIRLGDGTEVALGGDFNIYALQLEWALNERTSLVATKDGYIDFNPDANLSSEEGFANLGAGIKHALIYDPANSFILSGFAGVEIPTGNSRVWQGEGKGALDLRLAGLKMYDQLQFSWSTGLHIPFDDAESFTGSAHLHASYEVTPWFIPVVEVNWYHVFDAGDGSFDFNSQGGTFVSDNASFEGGDLINFGAAQSDQNRDIVTLGLGFRSRLSDQATLGVAYEMPLTDEETNLMDNRITASLTFEF